MSSNRSELPGLSWRPGGGGHISSEPQKMRRNQQREEWPGINQALPLSKIRLSANMEVIPLMTWKRAVSMARWGQKHDRGGFKEE